MKILFLTQYCPPEVGAPQNRIFEFAKELKKLGHDITILTAMPNYPKGEIFDEYKGKKVLKEELEGIKIVRTSIYATKEKSFTKRMRNYLSFTFSSVFQGAKYIEKQDVIITESPPLFLGWSGYVLSKLKGAKFVFNVSDLWPESAIKLGVLNNKLFIKMSTWLEEFCYRKADAVTGQTKGIVDNIVNRGFDKSKVHLITNGVNTEFFKKENRDENFRKEIGIENKFSIVYAGIHGLAQGLEVVIEAAEILKDYKDIQFIFIGDGPEKGKLINMSKEKNLENVKFLPVQPKSNMPRIIASMDATVIPLKKLDLFKGALPSKMFEALASQLPIILAVEGEAAKLINDAQAGIVVEPENPEAIAEAALKLYNDIELRKELGRNGRKYVMENFSRESITKKLEKILLNL
ncbi:MULTISPECIES: glycosyltransferase family 4 protein [Clostridium]|uniref:Alpha-D-kanosaminyltransferase n=2 Tax=Clostridium TaxID=1485 RepID=A0A151AR73_9CLOT|nr:MULTISPECIES: glycosyltransferase family 4 protein [Clostridium]KYH30144.1 alpha-D-kanosaminyltransferase [Clostridium colicanis DSM 13634]PRR75452.1 Alpha-D-kanosaminyltransferase [Clostridium thermopalmarium DSM 5974]PVZ24354.1 glycosyltransferase involved in cell wall biosynthesis [Clostridium thermopalmarium DSM 5974]